MKKLILTLSLILSMAMLAGAQSSIGIIPVQPTPNSTYPTAYAGLPIQVLGTTSGTVATATTVLAGTIYCVNLSGTAATVSITNTAGTYIVGGSAGFSIPANSDVVRNFESGLLLIGVKWWAGTAAVINCSITGWQ